MAEGNAGVDSDWTSYSRLGRDIGVEANRERRLILLDTFQVFLQ